MSQGKYSPVAPHANDRDYEYKFNCHGKIPAPYDPNKDEYDETIHFDDYDDEGYDSYGYSCFDSDGVYVGLGRGVDRKGYSESDYHAMSEEEFCNAY